MPPHTSLESKLAALLDLAETLGLEVRHVDLGGSGGAACVVRGKRMLFIDISTDVATQYDCALREISQITDFNTQFLRPDIREDLEKLQQGA